MFALFFIYKLLIYNIYVCFIVMLIKYKTVCLTNQRYGKFERKLF